MRHHGHMAGRPLTRSEVTALAEHVRALLHDPDANLTRNARLRWEGALTAVEYVLGRTPTLISEDPERFVL